MATERPSEAPETIAGLRGLSPVRGVMAALAAGYILVGVLMAGLGFNFLQADTLLYWTESQQWQSIFNTDYLPLYLPILAFLRTITFGLVSPVILMMIVNIGSLLAGAWFIYQIGRSSGASVGIAALCALLYGFWPLIGLPFTVYPRFDVPPMTLFVGGLYFIGRRQLWVGAGLFGLAMIGHKAVAPIAALSFVVSLLTIKPRLAPARLAGVLLAGFLPFIGLWLGGMVVHGSPVWMVEWNLGAQVASRSHLPVLDGAVGTFLRGEPGEIVKGIILAGFAASAACLGVLCLRDRPPMYLVGVIICAEIVALWLILNQFEIWAMARFSRLLLLPLMWLAANRFKDGLPGTARWRAGIAAGLAGLVLSQFVYAWYMVRVFYV